MDSNQQPADYLSALEDGRPLVDIVAALEHDAGADKPGVVGSVADKKAKAAAVQFASVHDISRARIRATPDGTPERPAA